MKNHINKDNKEYVFLTNFVNEQKRHIEEVLKLSNINEYFFADAKDILGNKLKNQTSLWINKECEDKSNLFFQTSLVLRSTLKKELIQKGYSVDNLDLKEIFIGMDLKQFKNKQTKLTTLTAKVY